jgi:maltose alpha-D-glucosyltransferase/alpha-amylase
MLGYVTFPTITTLPYPLTLAPYSFLWLELQLAPETPEPVKVPEEEPIVDLLSHGIEGLLIGPGSDLLQKLLIPYLPHQRWFGAKSRTINSVTVVDSAELPGLNAALVFLELTYDDGSTGVYQLPLTITFGEAAETIRASDPTSILATVTTASGPAILHDAVAREDVRQAILQLIEANSHLPTRYGTFVGHHSSAFAKARGADPLPARTGSAEQSNTSILYDAKLIMKLFRRLQPGENPDTEIGRFLTETAHFSRIAPFLGEITLHPKDGEPTTLAMLQGLVENEGDGWQWTLDELFRFYESVATLPTPRNLGTHPSFNSENASSKPAREHAALYLDAAALLGRRTAEMHLALATPTHNPAFTAECFTTADLVAEADRIDAQLSLTLDALKRGMSHLIETTADNAAFVLSRRIELFARAHAIASATPADAGQRIRIHGDYHLGQVLRSRSDYVILDFEGEPARSLAARRAKQSPLKDVAGMLRSFSYAAYAALNTFAQRRPDDAKNLEPWATLWQNAVSAEFLRTYQLTINQSNPNLIPKPAQSQLLLNAYLLEKSLYELLYELDNRPTWVLIPLAGILALLK